MKRYIDHHGREYFIQKDGNQKYFEGSFRYNILRKRKDFSSDVDHPTKDGLYVIVDITFGKNMKEAIELSEFAGFFSK